ncbi:unnamed protein product [Discula destructiva]
MAVIQGWESLVDDRIALAKECQKSDCAETLEKLLLHPTFDAIVKNGNDDESGDDRVEIRALHKDAVQAGRKAYDAFHDVVEGLKKETPNEDWEETIGAAGLMAKDAMGTALDTFAADSKSVIRALSDEEEQEDDATYFNYCVNGYVLFARKVNEALELVYEGRQGGQQRVWTALETAGRLVHDAEVAALKWVAGENAFATPLGVSFHA